MKYRLIYVILIITFFSNFIHAQTPDYELYTFNKIGFIENIDATGNLAQAAPYRTEINGLKVDFTTKGLHYSVLGYHRRRVKDKYAPNLDDGPTHEIIEFKADFPVLFVEPSDSLSIEAFGPRSNYVIQHQRVKQKCFDRIMYKNVWPNIHIEFTMAVKGGIKYNIYLEPGADVRDIKLDYNAAKDLSLIDGNLHVKSSPGKWVEYAPVSFNGAEQPLESSYKLENGILSFDLGIDEVSEPVVIDPWIALIPAIQSYDDLPNPADSVWAGPFTDLVGTGLDNAYNRVQIDYDAVGNIYLSQIACLFYESPEAGLSTYYGVGRYIHKFNAEGDLLFTVDQGYEFYICTDISVNKTSQNFYSSRDFSDLLYLSADGTTTDVFPIDELPEGIEELISIQYDHCLDKLLLGLGGDLNETGSFIATTGASFTGELDYSFAFDISLSEALPYNDNIDVLIDPYGGDYYMLFLLRNILTGFPFENRALLRTDPVNVDPIWQTNGPFLYLVELAMHSVGIIQGNLGRMHYEALACGKSSVYGMNGGELVQWDKSDGNQMNQVELSPFQSLRGRAEGIDIDMCGNLYVGGDNEIQVFDSLLNPLLNIPLAGMPQDIHVFGNKIYVAEDFNVESIGIPENISPWQFTQEPDSCNFCIGQASIQFCGQDDAPDGITVEWLANGDTGFSTTGLCAGWNQVKIFEEKGCYTNEFIDSVFVETGDPELCSIAVNVNDQTICEGACANIEAELLGQVTEPFAYVWSNGVSGNEPEIEVCPDSTTVYAVTVQDGNGEIVSDSMTVTVVPLPEVNLGADTALCDVLELQLDAGNPGATFEWQDGSADQTFSVTTSGQYSVEVSVDECVSSDSILVQFGSLFVDLGNDTTVCDLSEILLDAGDAPSQYTWQDGSTNQFFSPEQAGTFSVTVATGDCSATDSIRISVSEVEALFDYSNAAQCELSPVEFSNQSQSPTDSPNAWSWNFGDGTFSTEQNPTHLYESAGFYSVRLIVTDIFGCEDVYSEDIQVEVLPSPVALFSVAPATPVTYENVVFTDESVGAISWAWDLGDGTTAVNQNVLHSYEAPGEYPIELIVQGEFCSDTRRVILSVGEELIIYVPNSFSPNGDGVNDLFGPVISGGDVSDFEMLIFNRWGELIFQTNDITQRWNGARSNSGSGNASDYFAPNGVYAWQITVKENLSPEKKRLFGTVTLFR